MIARIRRGIVISLVLAAPALVAQTADQPVPAKPAPTAAHHKSQKPSASHKAPPPLVLPPLPSGPLSQVPLDKIPATPARVSFQGGMLTISAQNSSLGEILRDVRKLTGASIEFPPGSNGANERVVTHLGPGAPRDVLVGLLNGTSFNYVMLGSNSDPTAISSVILTPKESVAGQTQTVATGNSYTPPRPFTPQAVTPMPGNGVAEPAEGDDSNAQEEQEAEENADDQTQPGQPVQQPEQPGVNAQGQPNDPNQPNAGPKTPEQILEMLRRQQQPGAALPQQPQQPPQQQPEQ